MLKIVTLAIFQYDSCASRALSNYTGQRVMPDADFRLAITLERTLDVSPFSASGKRAQRHTGHATTDQQPLDPNSDATICASSLKEAPG
jgi:hypothetical protein